MDDFMEGAKKGIFTGWPWVIAALVISRIVEGEYLTVFAILYVAKIVADAATNIYERTR